MTDWDLFVYFSLGVFWGMNLTNLMRALLELRRTKIRLRDLLEEGRRQLATIERLRGEYYVDPPKKP